jgi:hypothetical protein
MSLIEPTEKKFPLLVLCPSLFSRLVMALYPFPLMVSSACGNWKNKGAAVCTSNSVRVEKANEYVFGKISELLPNEKMVRAIVSNLNRERVRKLIQQRKSLRSLTGSWNS